jgi:transmembrane protein TMEM43
MTDQFTETTSTSWFSRLSGAFGGIVTGLVLVAVACGALFWNEGRAVKRERALTEGVGIVRSVAAEIPDPANDNALVHVSGPVKVADRPTDPVFPALELPQNTIRLTRDVEMYQWKQTSKSETRKKLGGGTETVITYSYEKEWSPARIDSSNFKQPDGHANPDFAVQGHRSTAETATIGGFRFTGETLSGLAASEPIPANETLAAQLQRSLGEASAVRPVSGELYVGNEPASPTIGDLKVRLFANVAGEASVVGMQQSDRITPYRSTNGDTIFLTAPGLKPASEMFDTAQSSNSLTTWVIRLVGTLAVLVGFRMMFAIVGVVGDLVPFVGDVLRFATGFASLALTCVVAPVVIGTAWIAYRPVLGATVVVSGLLLAAAFFYLGKSRAAAKRPESTAEAAAAA